MTHEAEDFQLDVRNIAAAVSELGVGGNSPFLDGEFSGGECRIFKLSFADHASVAVRVRHASHGTNHENHIAMVEDEVETLRQLQGNGFVWAPKCLGACLTFDNPIKSPFSVLTWIDGSPLRWDEDLPPRPLRDEVLGKLASIQLSLMTCTVITRTQRTSDFKRIFLTGCDRTYHSEGLLRATSEKSTETCAQRRAPWTI